MGQIFENLHTIMLPDSTMGTVNVYLCVGDTLTLVDTGPRRDDTLTALRAGLAEYGYSLADIERIVITHAHMDHFGLAAQTVAESGAEVWAHQGGIDWLADFDVEWHRESAFLWSILCQGGVPEKPLAALKTQRESEPKRAETVSVDVLVRDGDVLSLGGSTWEVLYMPGHALDLICLYHRETGTFISSDHLLPDVPSAPLLVLPPRGTDWQPCGMIAYLASLRGMAELEINTVLPGHGRPIAEPHALIAERLDFHRERVEWISAPLEEGEKTAYQIWKALFPRFWPLAPWVGVAEIISYLDVFEVEGRLETYESEGLIYYRRVSSIG